MPMKDHLDFFFKPSEAWLLAAVGQGKYRFQSLTETAFTSPPELVINEEVGLFPVVNSCIDCTDAAGEAIA